MKNSNDIVGNRSHDLPVCSAVPQPLRHRVPISILCAGQKVDEKFKDIVGNRSHDLPVCSAVPQPLHHRMPISMLCTGQKEKLLINL
jgi:hypothetical protein